MLLPFTLTAKRRALVDATGLWVNPPGDYAVQCEAGVYTGYRLHGPVCGSYTGCRLHGPVCGSYTGCRPHGPMCGRCVYGL